MKHLLLAIIFVFGFYGCGGGGSGANATPDSSESKKIAYFLDSEISGIDYSWDCVSGTSVVGYNESGDFVPGLFYYKDSCNVEFKIGNNVIIGSIDGSKITNLGLEKSKTLIFPTDVLGDNTKDTDNQKVINFVRFIQSLDDDSDLSNGIFIDNTIKRNLDTTNPISLNFTNTNLSENDLNSSVSNVSGRTLVSEASAQSHLESTLKTNGIIVDNALPEKPILIDKNRDDTTLTNIRTFHTKEKTVRIKGEIAAKIFVASNFTGNMTNLNFKNTGLKIVSDTKYIPIPNGSQEIILNFDNDNEKIFHKYIVLEDESGKRSDILHLTVIKDFVPPHVQNATVSDKIFEEQIYFRNINASDNSLIKFYQIVSEIKDDRSIDDEQFQVDSAGNVTFKTPPDYDDPSGQKDFQLVARAIDDVGNMTDVLLKVSLKNLLDHPPVLKDNQNDFNTTLIEKPAPSAFVADLNLTLEDNLTIAPDNNITISDYFHFRLLDDHNDTFEVNLTTGIVTVKDENSSLLDYEYYDGMANSIIPIRFSVENNDTNQEGNPNSPNVTTGTLHVEIINKLDTKPSILPEIINPVYEQSIDYNKNDGFNLSLIDRNLSKSARDFLDYDLNFTIIDGNDNNFSIETLTGQLKIVTFEASTQHPDTVDRNPSITHVSHLDYEDNPEYNLTIRATNYFDDNSDGDFNDSNNKQLFYDEINVTIRLLNVIDKKPKIIDTVVLPSFNESIAANQHIVTIDANGTYSDENNITSIKMYRYVRSIDNEEMYNIVVGDDDARYKDDLTRIPLTKVDINATRSHINTSRSFLADEDFLEDMNGSSSDYTLTLRAQNIWWDGTTHESDSLNISFNVSNVIDKAPILIDINDTEFSFDENVTIGTIFTTPNKPVELNASGLYDEKNVTSFSIVSGNAENKFDINNSTGDIYIKYSLDWETTKEYTLEYKATNTWYDGTLHDSATKTITIDVGNVAEKVPSIFVPASIDIHENIDDGHILTYLETNSTEADEQIVNNITFSATPSDGNFDIENNDYNSTIKNLIVANGNTIDYEDTNTTYTLEINATNDFGTKTYSTQVNIIDDVESDIPLLVIMVSFNDINFTAKVSELKDLITEDLYDYFDRVSYKKFNFTEARETYGDDAGESGDVGVANDGIVAVKINENYPFDGGQLKNRTKSALTKVSTDGEVDFSIFDQPPRGNNDGNISKEELQILVLIAEDDNKSLDDEDLGTYSFDSNLTLNGVNVASVSDGTAVVIGEVDNNSTVTIGLIAKLLSEELFGFNVGNTDYKYEKLGLMGEGYQGAEENQTIGSMPVHPSIFNKMKQGWETPVLLRKGVYDQPPLKFYNTHDLRDYNTYRIDNPSDVNEYYLIENRNYTTIVEEANSNNYDNGFQELYEDFQGGLVIWKINTVNRPYVDYIKINTTDHFFRPDHTPSSSIPSSVQSIFTFQNAEISEDGEKTFEVDIEVK
jgi:hypothetical protein